MQTEITYIYLDREFNQLFTKPDKQAQRIPQKGDVLHLKHTTGATTDNHHYGKVLMVVESKHLYGFPKLEDCSVQRSKTLVYVQRLEVQANGVPAHLQLLEQLEAGVEVLPVLSHTAAPQIEIRLLPTLYADNRLELLPEISEGVTAFKASEVAAVTAEAPQPVPMPEPEPVEAAPMLPLSDKIVKGLINSCGISYPTRKKLLDALPGIVLEEQVTARKFKAIFNTLTKRGKVRKDSAEKLAVAVQEHIEKNLMP